MKISVNTLKASLTISQNQSAPLLERCETLEQKLKAASLMLEKSEKDLIQSQESSDQLKKLLAELRSEYGQLNEYSMKQQREIVFWRTAAIGSLLAVIGVGIYAALK